MIKIRVIVTWGLEWSLLTGEAAGTFWDDGNVLFQDWGSGNMSLSNLLNFTYKVNARVLVYMKHTLIQLYSNTFYSEEGEYIPFHLS